MAAVAALNSMQKAAMNSSIDGNVRRRDRPPPTAPYTTYYGTHPSSSEEDILLGGSYGIEEGLYMQRQRRKSISPWYKQPQKMILVATLCFVGIFDAIACRDGKLKYAHVLAMLCMTSLLLAHVD